jgi:GABA permease
MRLPIKSEPDAFRLAYGLAFVVGVSLLVGYLAGAIAGIVLFTAVALGGLALASRPERPTRLHEAELAGHRAGAGHRILIVANQALTGDALRDEILLRSARRPVLEVLAPVLQSRTHFVTTDIDRETEDARRRLRETLAWARAHGFTATGEVGDPVDPLAGLADELRRYDVDEVIIATHRPERANWVEDALVTALRTQVNAPLTHVVIDDVGAPRGRSSGGGERAS